MKVYQFVGPANYHDYAAASSRGTWSPSPGPGICPECTDSRQERVPPLLLMWEPGSDVIGDFTWPSLDSDVVVSDGVRRALEPEFCCMAFYSVEMLQPRARPRPVGSQQRTKPRVQVPYSGPPLWDMKPTAWCGVDQDASGVRLTSECSTCGRLFWEPGYMVNGIVVDGRTWQGADIFRLDAYPSRSFCTERVKSFVEGHGFTNVAFALCGEIGDAETATGPAGPHLERRLEIEIDEARNTVPNPQSLPVPSTQNDAVDREITYLPDNSPSSCPVDMQSILEYLAMEIPDEEISTDDLEFVRTAEIDGWQCWLWSFVDLHGEDSYATASLWPDGITSTMYDPTRGRTPEQCIWSDYLLYRRDR